MASRRRVAQASTDDEEGVESSSEEMQPAPADSQNRSNNKKTPQKAIYREKNAFGTLQESSPSTTPQMNSAQPNRGRGKNRNNQNPKKSEITPTQVTQDTEEPLEHAAIVPNRGRFFLHDTRGQGHSMVELTKDEPTWGHDGYYEQQQNPPAGRGKGRKPKSKQQPLNPIQPNNVPPMPSPLGPHSQLVCPTLNPVSPCYEPLNQPIFTPQHPSHSGGPKNPRRGQGPKKKPAPAHYRVKHEPQSQQT